MLSNMRIGAITGNLRSEFTLLGSLAACGGVVLLAFGCSSADTATRAPNALGTKPGVQLATCNNGAIDPGEDCDGANLNGQSCGSATMGAFTEGTLKCAPDNSCKFDMSGCTQAPGGPQPTTTGSTPPPPGPGSAGSTGTIDNGTGGGPGTSGGGSTGITPIGNGG